MGHGTSLHFAIAATVVQAYVAAVNDGGFPALGHGF